MKDFHFEISDATKVSGSLLWSGIVRADDEPAARAIVASDVEPRFASKLLRRSVIEVVPFLAPSLIQPN